MKSVYAEKADRLTIYCNAEFDAKKYVAAPVGFTPNLIPTIEV